MDPMGRDLEDGEAVEFQGSAARPYEIKNTGGVYSCTCPAWRNQSLAIERRTCKHIRKLRGEAAETERVGSALPPARAAATTNATAPPVLLAQKWEPHIDVTGWWLSEKLDGVRAYWDGEQFLSRLGNRFFAPDWFARPLPREPLDGELWVGRGAFQRTVSIVRRQDRSEMWREVSFLVFDAPAHGGAFEERLAWLAGATRSVAAHVATVEHHACEGTAHLKSELARIEGLGGEGLMARQPGSPYVAGRSHTLLKIKSFADNEAEVIGHLPGRGRHKGRLGALEARLADGTRFSVGTGLSDRERESPPPIGAIITVRYQELSRDGVPRFPAYVGVRDDVEWKPTAAAAKTAPKAKPKAKASTRLSPTAERQPSTSGDTMATRYFELSDGKSHKFWEIRVEGASHTVRYGRIGTNGTTKTKDFADAAAATADAAKLVEQKVKKGYEES
jgi:DNA ligase-1